MSFSESPSGQYDFALLGGGAAGLSLAYALINSPLRHQRILMIEKDAKDRNDRTWCFWANAPTAFDPIRCQAWQQLEVVSQAGRLHISLPPYRYQMLRGIDFYRFTRQSLGRHANVHMVQAAVEQVEDGPYGVRISAGGEQYRARWAFDSRFNPASLDAGRRYRSLKQHFLGWEIETEQPIFDPQTATLFDMRAPQPEGLSFFYVLPFNEKRALVEYTLFSASLLPKEAYAQALKDYLENTLHAGPYRLIEEEEGVIPMTDQPFERRLGTHTLAIGTRGGRVKPSTGYAFARIQRDTEAIVHSLVSRGHPFDLPPDSTRHRFFDSLLLDALAHSDPQLRPAFTALFKNNRIGRVFRFLDDQTSLLEDLQVLASLPPWPFIRALARRVAHR